MNINLPAYTLLLQEACAYYGMTTFPFTSHEVYTLHYLGFHVADAYNVACDVHSGFDFDCAMLANMPDDVVSLEAAG